MLKERLGRRVTHPDCSFDPKERSRGRAKQEFKEQCDVNFLIAKYRKLGVWPSGAPGVYEDSVSWPKDLAEAFDITARAAEQFEALPAKVRRRLGNDPRRLLELTGEDLEDLRAYLKKQEAATQPPVVGGPGGNPPGKASTPPRKGSAQPKPDEGDQE